MYYGFYACDSDEGPFVPVDNAATAEDAAGGYAWGHAIEEDSVVYVHAGSCREAADGEPSESGLVLDPTGSWRFRVVAYADNDVELEELRDA